MDSHILVFFIAGSLTLKTSETLAAEVTGLFRRKPFHAVEISKEIERHLQALQAAASTGYE